MTTAACTPVNDAPAVKKVEMRTVFCIGCHQPHSLDDDRLCEFCRREAAQPDVNWLGRLKDLVFKERIPDASGR